MRSYRFARRSFLTAIGGALGLRVLLRNFEAIAQGATSPPRFLMMHWPVGTIRYMFLPTGQGATYTPSYILQPFEDLGLRDGMTILYGLSMTGLNAAGGGGHEAGTPMATTGANISGVRENGGEADDGAAGGPSFDQIFLQNVLALQTPGTGFINTIVDARVDSLETSTQCLSYGYQTQPIQSANQAVGQFTENVPLLPQLSPLQAYTQLFGDFMPGGATGANQEALVRALAARQSVLDYALLELDQLRRLAPSEQADKIDLHAASIRNVEEVITAQLNGDSALGNGLCTLPTQPDPSLVGGNEAINAQGINASAVTTADDVIHDQIGKTHAAIIRAAFQCDLIRVATFQWSPGTNHVSFAGLLPSNPNAIIQHHPRSHDPTVSRDFALNTMPTAEQALDTVVFLANVQRWYNQRTGEILVDFRNTVDAFGGNLFDQTIFPYITEVAETTHSRSPVPALIFGGGALGMQHGQFMDFNPNVNGAGRPHNDLWMTIAQAYLNTTDPLAALTDAPFVRNGVSPIAGLWAPPA